MLLFYILVNWALQIHLVQQQKNKKLQTSIGLLLIIYPEYSFSLNCIQLYSTSRSKYLKAPGAVDKILDQFVEEIEILESEGININYNGQTHNLKGSLLFCVEDTPAAALLGDFKESVAAFRPCRTCMTDKDQWKKYFHERNFHLRDKDNHEMHIAAISDTSLSKTTLNYWKRLFGINRKSALS